jgi:acetaldehyde dehydrogenase (acetylating)
MHTRSREAAIAYGAQMPAARVIINSPTTHGAIGFSTALEPSMTLGCGSWGGNVTSDNISPLHLMDIKRVAFETKPVNASRAVTPAVAPPAPKPVINRQEIAAIVDKFLAQRPPDAPAPTATVKQIAPVEPSDNGKKPSPVAFVCEDDVRRAVAAKEKIYINAKTIITPAARDLGEAGEVFAKS